MKSGSLVLWAVSLLWVFPMQAYAEYEWCRIVRDPGQYRIVFDDIECPVRSAKYIDRVLKVNYDCLGIEGVRRGRFSGRQVGDSSFRGRYLIQSKLGAINGPLEISFLNEEQLIMKSRGKQYVAEIALYETD